VIRQELSKITKDQFHLIATEADENSLAILIIFSKNYAHQVRSFVLNENVNEVRLPEELSQMSYDKALARIAARKKDIPDELNQLEKEIKQLSDGWYLDLIAKKQVLSDRLKEIQLVPEFGQTDYTFIIEGWLPKKNLTETKKALKDNFGNKTVMQIIKLTEAENEEAPIQYNHSRLVKPFEPIAQMFGNPRYGQIDPSPFLALFFPLFFGIILGDMGYGLVVIFAGWLLKRKFKANKMLQGLGLILIMAGLSSFLFGFIYGEFFGDLPEILGIVRHVKILSVTFPWERSKSAYLMPTLLFAVALGIAHIFLGLVLGAINAVRARVRKHIIEKLSLLGALVSLFVIIAASSAYLPKILVNGGIAILVVFIALLIYSDGIMGPLEILGTLGNIVSYARIMAIGLVSVILADLANKFGGMMGNIFLGILVAALIHALNISIHVFTPSLQVLRLNFVEFYSKFYESGGKIYNPFRRGGEL
ncbi:MAG TPA: V-type ATP synthase subunit I, partial [Actinobacteria bacterium]|nr:V-type ATP synthase subunit I [Actinomycetes bacterium]HEX21549.1 V-type ATP synthase subunit I [Actinomycetota bacterium]